MSQNPKEPRSDDLAPPEAPPRRLFIFKAATVLSGAVAAAVTVASRSAKAQTDSDPSDPAGGGRGSQKGNTDSDPTDVVGYGKITKKGKSSSGNDADPTDRVGEGKGGSKWCTDSDPTDKAGKGRNC